MSHTVHRTYPARLATILNPDTAQPPQPIVVLNCGSSPEDRAEAEAIVRRAGARSVKFEERVAGYACLGFAQ